MENYKKRLTWIVIAGLFAFGLFFGSSRISAYAQMAVMDDRAHSVPVSQMASDSQISQSQQTGETEVYGTVEALSTESMVIGGRIYTLLPTTEFKTPIQVGDFVKLHVYPFGEGFAVREIERSTPGAMDDNSNQNGDDNGNTNGDDNGNTNGDDNGNTNDDDNGNTHGDDNGNTNDDDNGNTHDDDNGNTHDDDNGNTHDDDNGNMNGDDDDNGNGDDDDDDD